MITITRTGSITILSVTVPRLDAAVAVRFREESLKQIEVDNEKIIIDFGQVGFLDSSGLGALVSLVKRVSRHARPVICSLQPAVRTMFSLTRMDHVFTIHNSVEEAIEHFEK